MNMEKSSFFKSEMKLYISVIIHSDLNFLKRITLLCIQQHATLLQTQLQIYLQSKLVMEHSISLNQSVFTQKIL